MGFGLHEVAPMNIPTGFLDSSGSIPFSLPERDHRDDDPMARRISQNLRRLRDKGQVSLDVLAHSSGVRRALIVQIEAGRSIPSIKVLCRIAGALKVSIAEFLTPVEPHGALLLPAQDGTLQVNAAGTVTRRALYPAQAEPLVGFYELRLGPQAEEHVPGHEHCVQKNLVVAQGRLALSIGEEHFVLHTGDSILFRADQPHTYRNLLDSEAVAYLAQPSWR